MGQFQQLLDVPCLRFEVIRGVSRLAKKLGKVKGGVRRLNVPGAGERFLGGAMTGDLHVGRTQVMQGTGEIARFEVQSPQLAMSVGEAQIQLQRLFEQRHAPVIFAVTGEPLPVEVAGGDTFGVVVVGGREERAVVAPFGIAQPAPSHKAQRN